MPTDGILYPPDWQRVNTSWSVAGTADHFKSVDTSPLHGCFHSNRVLILTEVTRSRWRLPDRDKWYLKARSTSESVEYRASLTGHSESYSWDCQATLHNRSTCTASHKQCAAQQLQAAFCGGLLKSIHNPVDWVILQRSSPRQGQRQPTAQEHMSMHWVLRSKSIECDVCISRWKDSFLSVMCCRYPHQNQRRCLGVERNQRLPLGTDPWDSEFLGEASLHASISMV